MIVSFGSRINSSTGIVDPITLLCIGHSCEKVIVRARWDQRFPGSPRFPLEWRCRMKQLLTMLLLGGLASLWNVSVGHAQSVEPRFEVSSIKASVPGSAIHNPDCSGDRFAAAGLRFAYIL